MDSSRPKRAVRVFIDSSVLFSAAASATGYARDLVLQGIRGDLVLVYSDWVLEETSRNLTRKRSVSIPTLDELRAALPDAAANPPRELVIQVAQIIEPKDAPIVAAAIALEATHLATYDRRHLLSQADVILQHFGIIVATPDDILHQP
jgi:predicted nucleic acid-binding protein